MSVLCKHFIWLLFICKYLLLLCDLDFDIFKNMCCFVALLQYYLDFDIQISFLSQRRLEKCIVSMSLWLVAIKEMYIFNKNRL